MFADMFRRVLAIYSSRQSQGKSILRTAGTFGKVIVNHEECTVWNVCRKYRIVRS